VGVTVPGVGVRVGIAVGEAEVGAVGGSLKQAADRKSAATAGPIKKRRTGASLDRSSVLGSPDRLIGPLSWDRKSIPPNPAGIAPGPAGPTGPSPEAGFPSGPGRA
jgi:hypothetical protein